MKQADTKILATVLTGAIFLSATAAWAGAPGVDHATPTVVEQDRRTTLSPAELRNAVSIQLDTLAEQGIEIDRRTYDGIGLEWAAVGERVELFTEARLLAPRLENRAP